MRPRIARIFLGAALFVVLSEIAARPADERESNAQKLKGRRGKTQQDGLKWKQTKLELRDSSKGQHRKTRVNKSLKKKDIVRKIMLNYDNLHIYSFSKSPKGTHELKSNE